MAWRVRLTGFADLITRVWDSPKSRCICRVLLLRKFNQVTHLIEASNNFISCVIPHKTEIALSFTFDRTITASLVATARLRVANVDESMYLMPSRKQLSYFKVSSNDSEMIWNVLLHCQLQRWGGRQSYSIEAGQAQEYNCLSTLIEFSLNNQNGSSQMQKERLRIPLFAAQCPSVR